MEALLQGQGSVQVADGDAEKRLQTISGNRARKIKASHPLYPLDLGHGHKRLRRQSRRTSISSISGSNFSAESIPESLPDSMISMITTIFYLN